MKRHLAVVATTLSVLLLALASPGAATPITFSFTGTVTSIVTDPDDPFGGTIAFGTAISGSYTFESTTPDSVGGTNTGSYAMFGAPFGLNAVIGGNAFATTDALSIGIGNDFLGTQDQYSVLACAGGLGACFSTAADGDLTLELFFQGPASIFADDGLPSTPPAIASFLTADFRLFANVGGNLVEIQGLVDSLTCTAGCGVAAVPEPSPTVLMGAGIAAWAALSRRRQAMRILRRIGIVVTVVLAGATAALAVDGVVLIDQARALAGNVTPGDTPGFPVTISRIGSYRLSGNLIVPDENTTAIKITTSHVTLDLNGFTLLGPTVCARSPLACNPVGIGSGVDGVDQTGIVVVNGTVRGFGSHGLRFGSGSRIEAVQAVSNGDTGIRCLFSESVGLGCIVKLSEASLNGLVGINPGSFSVVSGNTVTSNGDIGIELPPGSTASGNTVGGHGDAGISAFGGLVNGNTLAANAVGLRGDTRTGAPSFAATRPKRTPPASRSARRAT